jgi:hypothetical protein
MSDADNVTRERGAPGPARDARDARRGLRVAAAILGALAIASFVAVWALPNMAGPFFVQVSALVAPRAAANGPTLIVADRAPTRATALDVGVEVLNNYPLSVVLGTGRVAFQAAVYRRAPGGQLVQVWETNANDPILEEGSDSPVGGGSAGGAAVVPTGMSRHDMTSSTTGFSLVDSSGAPLAAGVYYLRVWAYGIASQLVPLSLDGGTDPLGAPTDVPAPSN